MSKLSLNADSLPPDAKARYLDKIEASDRCVINPFSSDFVGEKSDVVPPVTGSGCDLVSYLVLQTSFITIKQFKAHKSLEAYNQFVSGWVKDVQTRTSVVSGKYVTTGRVLLSLNRNVQSHCLHLCLFRSVILSLSRKPLLVAGTGLF